MKSLMLLWQKVLEETGTWCHTSTTRDFETFTRRFEHEGLSFLTIALPAFCSDLQKGLDRGWVDHDLFKGFSFTGGLPRFLGGFLDLVFDRGTGRLLNEPDIDAIFALRQLTLMFGKLLVPCSDARIKKAIDGYIECEKEVRRSDAKRTAFETEAFAKMSLLLWGDVFQKVDEDVYYGRVVPQHGPGATADRLKGNQKYDQLEWTSRLEEVFPAGEFLIPSWRYHEHLRRVTFLEPGAERPVRVITVPKTLKTPRIIAVEPTCMQYAQQAIREKLYEYTEHDDIMSGIVGFLDQVPNQELAQQASRGSAGRPNPVVRLATLDLSEASDRVSNQLVRVMLRTFPNLAEGIDATRSRKADVPGHGVIRLAKYASMGSALCFPLEAMVFATTIFLGIQKELNRPLTKEDIKSFKGQVRVYGDDIIVPVDMVSSVVASLETFGFRVNSGKSFWNGKFRESCGKDYYDGHDVSVVRVRRFIPTQLKHVQEIISTVSFRNQLYEAGLWETVKWLDGELEKLIKHFPTVLSESPVLGRVSVLGFETQKTGLKLHNPLVKGYVVSPRLPESKLDDVGALLKVLLKQGKEPFADSKHLERAGRPEAVDIKLRWASSV